jgi:type IV secretory pathway VirD2 relaxase
MTRIIIRNKYYRGAGKAGRSAKAIGKKLSGHLKYLEHRPKDARILETRWDRSIFNAERDQVPRREAVDDIMEHRSARVDYHHLILSPDPEEPIADLRQWTREIMHDFAEQQGKEIHWYAVQHYNTPDHPHVHVVIAGAGEVKDHEEWEEPVTIFKEELDHLHISAFEHSDHKLYSLMHELHERDMAEQEPAHELDTGLHDLALDR